MLKPNPIKITVLAIITVFFINTATAQDFKQPDDMTKEDFALMNTASEDYNQCLQEKAMAVINDTDDPRHVADFAMKQCDGILQNLNTELEKRNFPPDFRKGYIMRINNRSARHLLTMLMVQMSARQQATEQDTNP